jgi:hypothetical protein
MLHDVLNFIRQVEDEPNALEMVKEFIIRLQMEEIVFSNYEINDFSS